MPEKLTRIYNLCLFFFFSLSLWTINILHFQFWINNPQWVRSFPFSLFFLHFSFHSYISPNLLTNAQKNTYIYTVFTGTHTCVYPNQKIIILVLFINVYIWVRMHFIRPDRSWIVVFIYEIAIAYIRVILPILDTCVAKNEHVQSKLDLKLIKLSRYVQCYNKRETNHEIWSIPNAFLPLDMFGALSLSLSAARAFKRERVREFGW